jgi:hypothetical protein
MGRPQLSITKLHPGISLLARFSVACDFYAEPVTHSLMRSLGDPNTSGACPGVSLHRSPTWGDQSYSVPRDQGSIVDVEALYAGSRICLVGDPGGLALQATTKLDYVRLISRHLITVALAYTPARNFKPLNSC